MSQLPLKCVEIGILRIITLLLQYWLLLEYFALTVAPATSVPYEQLFSSSGYSFRGRKNRINPENVKKVVFISENL